MAWRNLDIDQLIIAELLTRAHDARHDHPLSPDSGLSEQRVATGTKANGHPRQTQSSAPVDPNDKPPVTIAAGRATRAGTDSR